MKLKILIFCLLTAIVNVSFAQKGNGKILIPAGVGDKAGFIDLKGKWIINPQFENVKQFQDNGLAGVMLNGKWGWIDKTGKMVIEPKYDKNFNEPVYYDYADEIGMVVYVGRYDGFTRSKKQDEGYYFYGLVDRTGKTIIEPRFLYIGRFSNGLAPVKKGTWDSDIYGYIDTTGKMTIAAIYDYAESFTQNGLARVEIRGKWGLIDTAGKNVIEPQFAYAFPLHRGYSILSDSINWDDYYTHIFGNVDSTGKIYEFDNKYELSDFSSICCEDETDDELFGVKFNEKWGFIDNKGMIVIRPQFDSIGSDRFYTSEPLMAAEINGKWGFIDKTGKMVIEPQFDEAYAFDYFSYYGLDLAIVSIGDNKYLIDKSGKIFSSELQQFYGLYHLINGIIITRIISDDRKSQEWRYISKKGKHIKIPTQNIDWLFYESTNNLPDY
jgi:hypothetical protein